MMKLSELKSLCIKAIVAAEAHERKIGKLSVLPYTETPLRELQILFSELSERTCDAQL